jgi:predicted regulator of Ras-like GTPase activity (Roadblock/LC7/MglB family)
MVQDPSEVQRSLDWLVTDFTERVADVAHAVVVSSEGVPVAVSNDIPAGHAEQLGAITSGLAVLADDVARLSDGGMVIQALIESERGLMVVKAVSGGASLAVLAAPGCDTDLVAYEMTLLAEAAGDILTPATRP